MAGLDEGEGAAGLGVGEDVGAGAGGWFKCEGPFPPGMTSAVGLGGGDDSMPLGMSGMLSMGGDKSSVFTTSV